MTTSALKKCRIARADVVIGPYTSDINTSINGGFSISYAAVKARFVILKLPFFFTPV